MRSGHVDLASMKIFSVLHENILKHNWPPGLCYANQDPCSHESVVCGVTYIGETERRAVQRLVEGEPICLTGCPASAAGIADTWKATDHININVFNIELYKVTKL